MLVLFSRGLAAVLFIKTVDYASTVQIRERMTSIKMKFTSLGKYMDSRMAPVLPVKKKKPLGVEIGELLCQTLVWGFTPKGVVGAFQRGQYNRCTRREKGSAAGVALVLAAHMLSAPAFLTRTQT